MFDWVLNMSLTGTGRKSYLLKKELKQSLTLIWKLQETTLSYSEVYLEPCRTFTKKLFQKNI